MSDIGIVIVTYNSESEIGACVDAAMKTGAEVVVVDNASSDASAAEARRRGARVLVNQANRGFAAAVNQGFAALHSSYILLLNPDAILLNGIETLRAACNLPGSAGAGGLLIGEDGRPQVGFMARALPTPAALILEALVLNRLWPRNPVNYKYRNLGLDVHAQTAVEQPAGAFLMIRRTVWQDLGGFDEHFYPIWFEDVDFCRRVLDRGYYLYYEPSAVAKHTGGHSIPQLKLETRRYYWYRSLLRYSAKHFRTPAFRAVCLAVALGSFARGSIESLAQRSLGPLAAAGKVVRLAGRCLFSGWRESPGS